MQQILTRMQVKIKRGFLIHIFPVHKIHVPETDTASVHIGINYKTCVQSRERPLKV